MYDSLRAATTRVKTADRGTNTATSSDTVDYPVQSMYEDRRPEFVGPPAKSMYEDRGPEFVGPPAKSMYEDGGSQFVGPPASEANKGSRIDLSNTLSEAAQKTKRSLNKGVNYVKNVPSEIKDFLSEKSVAGAEDLYRSRYGAKKGVPLDKALSRLANSEVVQDVATGRYLPGIAKRDSSGNIMTTSYPFKTHGRNPHSSFVAPGTERGIEPGTEFMGPPQLPVLSQKSWDYAKDRIYDLKRYGGYADSDLGYEQSNKSFHAPYMPDVVMRDMADRHKAFGQSLGFSSQQEYDEHVKRLIDQEVRFRNEDFKQQNLKQLKKVIGLGTSLAAAPFLSARGAYYLSSLTGAGRALANLSDPARRTYETYIANPPGFVGRGNSAKSFYNDVLTSDSPTATEFRSKFNRDLAQALYSGYESGELSNVKRRLSQVFSPVNKTVSTPTPTEYVDSAADLSKSMRNLSLNLAKARQSSDSPFNSLEGIRHLANSELFDRMTARQLANNPSLNYQDVSAFLKNLAGTTKDTLIDYAKNNPGKAALKSLPALVQNLPVPIPESVASAIVKPISVYNELNRPEVEYETYRRGVEAGRPTGELMNSTKRQIGRRLIESAPSVARDIYSDTKYQPGYQDARLGITANKFIDENLASKIQDIQLANGYNLKAFPSKDMEGRRYTSVGKELLSDAGRVVANMDNLVYPAAMGLYGYRTAKPLLNGSTSSINKDRVTK